MKGLTAAGLVGGVALATVLVLSYGAGAVWRSSAALGWGGFAIVTASHLGLIGFMGAAWWLLGRGRPDAAWPRFVWGRLIRDSAAEALPLSQIGGYVLGARAAALAGVSSGFTAASTVVDVTDELVAQLVYTLLGLVLLDRLQPQNAVTGPAFAGLAAMAALVGVFIAVQARGAGFVERAGLQMARRLLGRALDRSAQVGAGIQALQRRPGTLLLSGAVHLVCWVLSGVETWLTLWLMGIRLSVFAGIAIDSLLYGVRSVAFMVPNAAGVQEGGLVALGSLFGFGPDAALALSLIKRARDLVIGVPALLLWQVMEGRRVWRPPDTAAGDGPG